MLFSFHKNESSAEEKSLTLLLNLEGTDVSDAIWRIDQQSLPRWLSLPPAGYINSSQNEASIPLNASAAGLAERAEAYEATVNVTVFAQARSAQLHGARSVPRVVSRACR